MSVIKRGWFPLLMLGALLARLPQLAAPYWYDEAWTQWIATLPFARMWAAVVNDVHPVGFFVLTWLVAQIVPWATRILPLVCSLLAIVLTREIARSMALPIEVQVIALLLMAFTPWSIYFGAELRAYAMLECAVLCAWLCVLRRWWWGLAASFFSILTLHNIGFIYCAVIGLCAVWRARRERWCWPALAGAGALAAYAPLARIFISQLSVLQGGYWIQRPNLADVLLTPYDFLFLGAGGVLTVPALVFTVILVLLIARRWPQSPFLAVAAGAPAALALAISWISVPIYLSRSLIGCAPFFYLLAGQTLSTWRGAGRVAAMAAAVPLLAVLTISPARQAITSRYQSAEVAAIIRAGAPDVPIWNLGPSTLVELHQYHLPNPQYLSPGFASIGAGHYSAGTMAAMEIAQRPLSISGQTWIIVPRDEAPDAPAEIAALCVQYSCKNVLTWTDAQESIYGVEVWKICP